MSVNIMAKKSTTSKRKMAGTYCLDCTENQETCGKDPLKCRKKAQLYFELYDGYDSNFCRMWGEIMINLSQQVFDYLGDTDFEIDEVYQVFQVSTCNVIAEARIFHPSGSGEEKDVVIEIIGDQPRILQSGDSQKLFVEIVHDSNY